MKPCIELLESCPFAEGLWVDEVDVDVVLQQPWGRCCHNESEGIALAMVHEQTAQNRWSLPGNFYANLWFGSGVWFKRMSTPMNWHLWSIMIEITNNTNKPTNHSFLSLHMYAGTNLATTMYIALTLLFESDASPSPILLSSCTHQVWFYSTHTEPNHTQLTRSPVPLLLLFLLLLFLQLLGCLGALPSFCLALLSYQPSLTTNNRLWNT